ncbi:hypothetical protein OHB41_25900 [Streptomyces sp. NBC_01571]|uniref:hypothetical protein n=1 Tax=Streptomyces sp. NBC_01571 TaxID=2975883 RepID=UPI002250BB89|nr:hypothetical protein [Streptomyces sp. NBC_01571]MCX4576545.1 hypothetical protein [Streptomyces sp. NBC_01571]
MMRILFGALLALVVAWPPLFQLALFGATAAVSCPPVLAFAAGVLFWPRVARKIKRWAR